MAREEEADVRQRAGRDERHRLGAAEHRLRDEVDRVLLERQFRYPHRREFIELPAGKLEPGEPHAENARRELLESMPPFRILFKHIVPQMSSILVVSVTLGVPGFILGETVLSYLGLGIVDPAVSWGSMINRDAISISNIVSFPWLLTPGYFLLIVTVSFNFLGELLRDAVDPNWREKRGG